MFRRLKSRPVHPAVMKIFTGDGTQTVLDAKASRGVTAEQRHMLQVARLQRILRRVFRV
jgi:hypothetical protein